MGCNTGLIVFLVSAMSLAACSSSPLDVRRDPNTGLSRVSLPGGGELSQAVTLTPEQPRQGEAFEVRSVLRNTGSRAVSVVAATCLLPLSGALAVDEPLILCAAVSMATNLAPAESLELARIAHTSSGPGTYELRVQHLLEPAVVVPVQVTVLP
jgi:hypothetical protein